MKEISEPRPIFTREYLREVRDNTIFVETPISLDEYVLTHYGPAKIGHFLPLEEVGQ